MMTNLSHWYQRNYPNGEWPDDKSIETFIKAETSKNKYILVLSRIMDLNEQHPDISKERISDAFLPIWKFIIIRKLKSVRQYRPRQLQQYTPVWPPRPTFFQYQQCTTLVSQPHPSLFYPRMNQQSSSSRPPLTTECPPAPRKRTYEDTGMDTANPPAKQQRHDIDPTVRKTLDYWLESCTVTLVELKVWLATKMGDLNDAKELQGKSVS